MNMLSIYLQALPSILNLVTAGKISSTGTERKTAGSLLLPTLWSLFSVFHPPKDASVSQVSLFLTVSSTTFWLQQENEVR